MIAEQQKCLDAATLADLLAGRMPTDRFTNAIEHIESCEPCMRAAEENSNNAKLPWLFEASESSSELNFDIEPECSAVVGNLLVQPVPYASDRSGSNVEVPPPKEILGPYRLISSLGSGGMGTVYLAEHQRLKRQVALKILPRDKLARSGWLDRFNREMTAIAALEHPHVVRALDAGDEDQWHYLVMEYLDGLDLNRVARRIPDIPRGAACEIIRQAALGLGAIHDAGMIHRDIKPSNVFLTRTGAVKLLDLGLVLDGESPLLADERLTTVGHLMGTLPFMAREQLDDARNVDWRADIYSLGATLYRLLSGRPPFGSADNLARTIHNISTTEAPSIATGRSNLPAELICIVNRMIHSDITARPQSAKEVAELLKPFCDESGPKELIRAAMQCNVEDELSLAKSLPMIVPASSPPPRSRWPWWIAVALLPFAFAAGIFVTIVTDNGTLVIETDEPNANVKIVQGDKVFNQLEVAQSKPSTLTLRSGKYVVELTGVDSDRMEVKNDQVILSRGERQVAKVIRKESNAMAESVKPTSNLLSPTMPALSVPTKTFQDKSLAEWTEILSRERSGEVLAQAMEAVNILVDTPEEKLAAMRLFLRASRQHGTDYVGSKFMNSFVKHFQKLFSAAPEGGLAAIADEFESGTEQSKLARLGLISRILPYDFSALASAPEKISKPKSLLRDMNQTPEGRGLLLKLDSLVSEAIRANDTETFMLQPTLGTAFQFRVAIGSAMERDLTLDSQIMHWAKEVLVQTNMRLKGQASEATIPNAAMPALEADSALTNYFLLKGTKLDLSPLILGLTKSPPNANQLPEIESVAADLCRRSPVKCALACETHLNSAPIKEKKLGNDTRSKLFLETFAKNHPRPMDAVVALLKCFAGQNTDVIERILHNEISCLKELLVRVVLESELAHDTETDSKLSYAASTFAYFGIPATDAEKVMGIFLARLRDVDDNRISHFDFSIAAWYQSRTYDAQWKSIGSNTKPLFTNVLACCTRNPSSAVKAYIKEIRIENGIGKLEHRNFFHFLRDPLVAGTAKERRPAFEVNLMKAKSVADYLQTEAGKSLVADLGAALDETIERLLKGPIPRDGYDDPFSFSWLVHDRLLIARFLNQAPKDFEPVCSALRYLANIDSSKYGRIVEEEIAELVGYANYPINRLILLAKGHGRDTLAKNFVARIGKADPSKFQTYFLTQFAQVKTCEDASSLFGRGYDGLQGSNPESVWNAILQELLGDSASRSQVESEMRRIFDMVRSNPEETNGKQKADALRMLLETK